MMIHRTAIIAITWTWNRVLVSHLVFQRILVHSDAFSVPSITISQSEALQKFQEWSKCAQIDISNSHNKTHDTSTLEEFVVEELPQDDRSCRISHFGARIFQGSLQTSNAANEACGSGTLKINDAKVSGGRLVRIGDRITFENQNYNSDRRTTVPEDSQRAERFVRTRLRLWSTLSDEKMSHAPLRVLYEDDSLAVVCKPAGIHTMSWAGSYGKCLCLDEILPLMLEPPKRNNHVGMVQDRPLPAPLPRHRLDKRVAGPVVVAKTRRASVEIGRCFEEKRVEKEYRAIVVGEVQVPVEGSQEHDSNTFTIESEIEGRLSQTEVTVLGQTPCPVNGVLTDLMLFPRTGRKHQLRIHCAKILGTPILGDDLHFHSVHIPGVNENVKVRRGKGLYLYCRKVAFDYGERVSAEISEPLRFRRTREKALKGYEWTKSEPTGAGD